MRAWCAAALVALTTPAAADAMSVAQFLQKAKALQAQGVFALASPDVDLLKDEMRGITRDYRANLAAAKKAGRTPHSCPPAPGTPESKINPMELIRELETIPVAQRGKSMKTAFYGIMKRRYPCKG